MTAAAEPALEAFIARWGEAGGSERANYQLFVNELCELLGVPKPDPARDDTRDNAYVFERRVTFRHGDGTETAGFIDLYRRSAFVLEAKKVRKARGQRFRRRPAARPRSGRAVCARIARPRRSPAVPPRRRCRQRDRALRRVHPLRRDLRPVSRSRDRTASVSLICADADLRERLRAGLARSAGLDPSRAIGQGHAGDRRASWRSRASRWKAPATRPNASPQFPHPLPVHHVRRGRGAAAEARVSSICWRACRTTRTSSSPLVAELWRAMDSGGFSAAIRADVLRFNGKLFSDPHVLPLDRDQIDLLLEAARADWRDVEPAIFGTLLERALDPTERHALGAHYTPRAYVERLVLPTVVEPLREDWKNAQAAALVLAGEGKLDEARSRGARFPSPALRSLRVLDPACGSGNFLYVTLEHLKRLEGEVLNQLDELGDTQGRWKPAASPSTRISFSASRSIRAPPRSPRWCSGSAICNGTSAPAASVMPPQPVLKDFHNIECRDAVLAYDRIEYVRDEHGVPVTPLGRPDHEEASRHGRRRAGRNRARAAGAVCESAQGGVAGRRTSWWGIRRSLATSGCGRARRWLCRGAARRVEGRSRIGRLRHVLVGSCRRNYPSRQAAALRADHHQQPETDLQSADHRPPPWRQAAARAALCDCRPSVDRQCQRCGGTHCDDGRRYARRRGKSRHSAERGARRRGRNGRHARRAQRPRACRSRCRRQRRIGTEVRANAGLCFQGYVLVGEGFPPGTGTSEPPPFLRQPLPNTSAHGRTDGICSKVREVYVIDSLAAVRQRCLASPFPASTNTCSIT